MTTYRDTLDAAIIGGVIKATCEPARGRHVPDEIACPVCGDQPAFVTDFTHLGRGHWYFCVTCRAHDRKGCVQRHECR